MEENKNFKKKPLMSVLPIHDSTDLRKRLENVERELKLLKTSVS